METGREWTAGLGGGTLARLSRAASAACENHILKKSAAGSQWLRATHTFSQAHRQHDNVETPPVLTHMLKPFCCRLTVFGGRMPRLPERIHALRLEPI